MEAAGGAVSLKVNLGCGHDVRPGWINIDRFPQAGALRANIDEGIPIDDGVADYVLASHVLEHVQDFAMVWREIHRILRVGGILEVHVPYGFNTDPYHVRYFDRRSVERLLAGEEHAQPQDVREFRLVRMGAHNRHGFPRWHLWRYLGLDLAPFRRGGELEFVLEKIA